MVPPATRPQIFPHLSQRMSLEEIQANRLPITSSSWLRKNHLQKICSLKVMKIECYMSCKTFWTYAIDFQTPSKILLRKTTSSILFIVGGRRVLLCPLGILRQCMHSLSKLLKTNIYFKTMLSTNFMVKWPKMHCLHFHKKQNIFISENSS